MSSSLAWDGINTWECACILLILTLCNISLSSAAYSSAPVGSSLRRTTMRAGFNPPPLLLTRPATIHVVLRCAAYLLPETTWKLRRASRSRHAPSHSRVPRCCSSAPAYGWHSLLLPSLSMATATTLQQMHPYKCLELPNRALLKASPSVTSPSSSYLRIRCEYAKVLLPPHPPNSSDPRRKPLRHIIRTYQPKRCFLISFAYVHFCLHFCCFAY